MASEVLFTVLYQHTDPPDTIRKLHTFTPAVLDGYCRHRVKLEDYPGIIPELGRTVLGVYATGLTDANMEKLDYFEGPEYSRRAVTVKLAGVRSGSHDTVVETSTYIYNQPADLEEGEWDFEHFRKEKISLWSRGDFVFEGEEARRVILNGYLDLPGFIGCEGLALVE
jgi:hypothetical protein